MLKQGCLSGASSRAKATQCRSFPMSQDVSVNELDEALPDGEWPFGRRLARLQHATVSFLTSHLQGARGNGVEGCTHRTDVVRSVLKAEDRTGRPTTALWKPALPTESLSCSKCSKFFPIIPKSTAIFCSSRNILQRGQRREAALRPSGCLHNHHF